MDIFFQESAEASLPPDEVRIRELHVEPWSDGQRVKVNVELDAFQQRPNLSLSIRNALGKEITEITIIEPITRKISVNMHLREVNPGEDYSLLAVLYYELPLEEQPDKQDEHPQMIVVDRKKVDFNLLTNGGLDPLQRGDQQK
jgi:hypothetical protein